ncbi:MAG: hypothetical protein WKG07_07570 [Hymenobacter sp.]
MAAVGILVPQLLWCLDFVAALFGFHLVGLTAYMFDPQRSLFLRGLSFFHGWLPFLLLFLVRRLGYDRRALLAWTGLGWGLCLVACFLLPPAGTVLPNPQIPVNINYVFGFDDAHAQNLAARPGVPAELDARAASGVLSAYPPDSTAAVCPPGNTGTEYRRSPAADTLPVYG